MKYEKLRARLWRFFLAVGTGLILTEFLWYAINPSQEGCWSSGWLILITVPLVVLVVHAAAGRKVEMDMVKARFLSYFLLLSGCCFLGMMMLLGSFSPAFDYALIGHREEGEHARVGLTLNILFASLIAYGFVRVIRGKILWE